MESCHDENYIIDSLTDSLNPKCVSTCNIVINSTTYTSYIDSITVSGVSTCVLSCKNLEPAAYININDKECVSNCEGYYINDIDATNPKCVSSCPTENPYSNNN